MEGWNKKELLYQGTEELRAFIKDEFEIDNKSILDDFTNHATVAGATFFNSCWSIGIVFSRLLAREYLDKVGSYHRILPHPLYLLFSHSPETNTYNLATTSLYVPTNEYKRLYNVLINNNGAYKIPKYQRARRCLTILCDLIRWFIINKMNNQTSLFTYDSTNDCVSLHMSYSRQGKCLNNLDLLELNLYLETEISNIVGTCSYRKFCNHGKDTFDDFMNDTILQSTTSIVDDDKSVTNINEDNDALGNKNDTSLQKLTPGNDGSPPTVITVNKNLNTTTNHSTVEVFDVEGDNTTVPSSHDIAKDNNDDKTNQVVTQYDENGRNTTDTDYSSLDDDDEKENRTILSPNNNDNVDDNTEINDQLASDNEDNERRDKNNDTNQLVKQKSILILGMSTVDVQRTLIKKGISDILDEITLSTAKQCVARKIISPSDGRDLARINAIKNQADINVYTVSLVNTNPTNDSSSNPTVYDEDNHLHADYNGRNFVSSLIKKFRTDNHQVQFQEIVLDYYYMPAVSYDIVKYLNSVLYRNNPIHCFSNHTFNSIS